MNKRARMVGEAEGTPDSVMRIPAGLYDSTPTPVGAVFPESGVTLIEPTFVDVFDPSVWKTNVPFAGMLYEKDDATVPSSALTVKPVPASSKVEIVPRCALPDVFNRTTDVA